MEKIIATVGPSLLNKHPISELYSDDLIFRVNGAHGSISDITENINRIRKEKKDASILMDLPGNKIRTNNIMEPLKLTVGEPFELSFQQTNFINFFKYIKKGDKVWANDSTYEFEVIKVNQNVETITFLSKSDGFLLNNKGMHVRGIHRDIPFLFDKDIKLIEIANKLNLEFIGLSFVRNLNDIKAAKELVNQNTKIITKVETKAAVQNLKEILNNTDFILIDRGDLSTEVGLENIPSYQRHILNEAKINGVKTFLATQFLKNMEINPIPSIPEIIDLYNTVADGVYGIQLSEETAVGKYPYDCVQVVRNIIKKKQNSLKLIDI